MTFVISLENSVKMDFLNQDFLAIFHVYYLKVISIVTASIIKERNTDSRKYLCVVNRKLIGYLNRFSNCLFSASMRRGEKLRHNHNILLFCVFCLSDIPQIITICVLRIISISPNLCLRMLCRLHFLRIQNSVESYNEYKKSYIRHTDIHRESHYIILLSGIKCFRDFLAFFLHFLFTNKSL